MSFQPPNQPPLKFITVEGGEGSGKSTLIQGLKKSLQAEGFDLLVTREPGGSPLGESIRHLLLHRTEGVQIAPMSELLLFLAARAQHIEETIGPAIAEGKLVLCDRFNDSTIAYQGAARQLDLSLVEELCYKICNQTLPDLTLLLDLDPEVGFKRIKASRASSDQIENEALYFHVRVRQGFQTLAARYPERIISIDATLKPHIVLQKALHAIQERMHVL